MGEVQFKLGPAVRDGVIRFLSVSQIESFDPECYGGCHRRWWFRRVARQAEAQGRPAALGEQVHLQLERFLLDGNQAPLGEIARAGLRFLPAPGADLRREWSFGELDTATSSVVSPLSLAGVPLIGKVDLAHRRGAYVDGEGQLVRVERLAEVLDHKTTSRIFDEVDGDGNVRRKGLAKTAAEVAATHQMRAYAALVVREWPETEWVAVSHVYYQTRWPLLAEKRVRVVDASGAEARFLADEPLVERMKATARLKVVTDVEANIDACGAFGGCPHRESCPRPIAAYLGSGAARAAAGEVKRMGLLERRKQEAAAATKPAVEAEIKRLEAVEANPLAPPDEPAPVDIAQAEEAPAPEVAPGKCPKSGAMVKLTEVEAARKEINCECAALVAVKPKKLADGPYALVPEHAAGVDVVRQKSTKAPKKEASVAAECGLAGYSGFILYVDASPDGAATQRLEDYAQRLADELAAAEGAADIRCAPERSALAFGKWKGALAAACKASPPDDGLYEVASSSEIGMVALEALRSLAALVVRSRK